MDNLMQMLEEHTPRMNHLSEFTNLRPWNEEHQTQLCKPEKKALQHLCNVEEEDSWWKVLWETT